MKLRKLWNIYFLMVPCLHQTEVQIEVYHGISQREVGHLINNLNLCLIMAWFRCFYFWGVLELDGWCVIGNFVTSISGMNFNSAKITLFWEVTYARICLFSRTSKFLYFRDSRVFFPTLKFVAGDPLKWNFSCEFPMIYDLWDFNIIWPKFDWN